MVDKKFVVTPWEVTGEVDYERLIRDFGTQHIAGQLAKRLEGILSDAAYLVRRQVFFSHRDLNFVLDDYDKGKRFFLYTGRGPSGPMHIGHILSFYFTKWLQDKFKVNVYIQMTDDEKFLEEKRSLTYEDTQKWAQDNTLEVAAVGFDPDKTFIFQDTELVGHAYPMILKIARRINYSTAKSVFGFTAETNIGMSFYPAIQILQSRFHKNRCLLPSPDDKRIEEIRSEYKGGRMLTGDLKDILVEKVTKFLREHRERREKARAQVHLFKKDGALAREMWKHDFSKS